MSKGELRATAKAASEALHIKSTLAECGLNAKVAMKADNCAVQLNAAKLGPGRVAHRKTQPRFVKEAVHLKLVHLHKVRTDDNMSKIVAKHARGLIS